MPGDLRGKFIDELAGSELDKLAEEPILLTVEKRSQIHRLISTDLAEAMHSSKG
jgi:hypothetical protein